MSRAAARPDPEAASSLVARPLRRALVCLIAVAALASVAAAGPITIGPGPAIGTDRAGVTWYEEFQDWTHADLKALDDAGSADQTYLYHDGYDDSRDLVAFYQRAQGDSLFFRVDFYDLALGAETTALDLYLAIDAAPGGQSYFPDFVDCQTDRPWELCVNVYQSGTLYGTDYGIYDKNFTNVTNAYLGSHFDSQLDAVEFGIKRSALIAAGWDGSRTLYFQPFTTKDGGTSSCPGGSKLADAFVDQDRGCSDGFLNGGIASSDTAGRVWYASIAHGNQSVNKAGDVGVHIYDSQASTGISGGTGFLRTLDTHEMFRVPLNIHPSGTLTMACNWAATSGGASDPQDGPSFIARVRQFVNDPQKGSLIGGVLAEHIMPYFEGPVNAAALAFTDSLNQVCYGVSAAQAKVMHTPERVIRSQDTGLSPLDGRTFEDLAASPYPATYLDEVTHLHWWFYPGESCTPDAGYRHKVHRINGVYCFMINDREDQAKFGNWDSGMVMDTRFSLLQKALYGGSSEIVVVFDDWEALAGKSFDPVGGVPVPNNNPNQYHNTVRWAANHPWITVSNLRDLLAGALANPAAFVVDHGTRYDLTLQTYEYLKHSSEDAYHYWYYNSNAGFPGNEQSFYDLVPVITGPQGDYHARGATPANDGPPLPSGKKHGDLNTPGTLLYDTWQAIGAAPAGRLRDLARHSYLAMIYETAWHEEDNQNYTDSNCYGAWLYPDATWDGVNTWALRLQNHARGAGLFVAADQWANDVRTGAQGRAVATLAADLDWDGENEYVVKNDRVFLAFEKYGGRCVLACAYDAAAQDAEVIVGAPYTNPSAPGEEELTGGSANRCSAFKEMNGGTYADAVYAASAIPGGWRFTSPDGKVVKDVVTWNGSYDVSAGYVETVSGPLYVRLGLSPNPLDLALHGHDHLSSNLDLGAGRYWLQNSAGGGVIVNLGGTTFNASPAYAGWNRRNLALTEEVELSGDGSFSIGLTLVPSSKTAVDVPHAARPANLALSGPWPSPSSGPARLAFALPERASVRIAVVDITGRRVASRDLGMRGAGFTQADLEPRDESGAPLAPGLYFVRVEAGPHAATARWVVMR